jgi:hypothetical protein
MPVIKAFFIKLLSVERVRYYMSSVTKSGATFRAPSSYHPHASIELQAVIGSQ